MRTTLARSLDSPLMRLPTLVLKSMLTNSFINHIETLGAHRDLNIVVFLKMEQTGRDMMIWMRLRSFLVHRKKDFQCPNPLARSSLH